MVKKAGTNLELTCEGIEWLAVLPISQGGTGLSREDLTGVLWWSLDLPLKDPLYQ